MKLSLSVETQDILDFARFETGPQHLGDHQYFLGSYTDNTIAENCTDNKAAGLDIDKEGLTMIVIGKDKKVHCLKLMIDLMILSIQS